MIRYRIFFYLYRIKKVFHCPYRIIKFVIFANILHGLLGILQGIKKRLRYIQDCALSVLILYELYCIRFISLLSSGTYFTVNGECHLNTWTRLHATI